MSGSGWVYAAGEPVLEFYLEVDCSSGTYIRSLAWDLARAAGSEGHIHSLRRSTVGPFDVADAVTGIMNQDGERLAGALRPLTAALPQAPSLTLDEEESVAVRQGHQPGLLWLERLDRELVAVGKAGRLFRMLDGAGDLVAVGRLDEDTGEPRIAAVIAVE